MAKVNIQQAKWFVLGASVVCALISSILLLESPLAAALFFFLMIFPFLFLKPFPLVVFLIVFSSFSGVYKVFLGTRFLPLIVDLTICVLLVKSFLLAFRLKKDPNRMILLFIVFFNFLSLVYLFNPFVYDWVVKIIGYRYSGFYLLAFFLSYLPFFEIETNRRNILKVFVAISVLAALNTFRQMVLPFPQEMVYAYSAETSFQGGVLRPFSFLPDSFNLSLLLVFGILMAFHFLIVSTSRKTLFFLIIFTVPLLIAALVFTRVRGSWVSLLIGSVFMFISSDWNGKAKLLKYFMLVAVICFLSFSILLKVSGKMEQAHEIMGKMESFRSIKNDQNILVRQKIWARNLKLVKENPLGFGVGTSGAAGGRGYSLSKFGTNFIDNNYVKTLLELGVLGLVVLILINALLFIRLLCLLRARTEIGPLALAVFFAYIVAGLTITTSEMFPMNFYFWFLMGIFLNNKIPSVEPRRQSRDVRVLVDSSVSF